MKLDVKSLSFRSAHGEEVEGTSNIVAGFESSDKRALSSRNKTGRMRLNKTIAKGLAAMVKSIVEYDAVNDVAVTTVTSFSTGQTIRCLFDGDRMTYADDNPHKGKTTYYVVCGLGCYHLVKHPQSDFAVAFALLQQNIARVGELHGADDELFLCFLRAADELYYVLQDLDGRVELSEGPVPPHNAKPIAAAKTATVGATKPSTLSYDREFTDREKTMLEDNARKVAKYSNKLNETLVSVFRSGDIFAHLFYGPAGTGKSTLARQIAHEIGQPVIAMNFSFGVEESNILGHVHPSGNGFDWVNGAFTDAFEHGWMFVADELNYAKPGFLAILNSALDQIGAYIRLDNGRVIERHPNFRFVATSNLGYAGTQRINEALEDRMLMTEFMGMSDSEMIEQIIKESGYANRRVVEKMLDCYKAIKSKMEAEEVENAISIRGLIRWAQLNKYGNIVLENAQGLINQAGKHDQQFKSEVYEIVKSRCYGLES